MERLVRWIIVMAMVGTVCVGFAIGIVSINTKLADKRMAMSKTETQIISPTNGVLCVVVKTQKGVAVDCNWPQR